MAGSYIVYMLHFAIPIHKTQHYVGITRAENFERRMREHGNGTAAALTREVARRNIDMFVSRTWLTDDVSFERKVKSLSHFKRRCPVCTKGLNPYLTTLHHVVANPIDAQFATATLGWSNLPKCTEIKP